MRNGNHAHQYSRFSLLKLFILPMRNGNPTGTIAYWTNSLILFILPMRNGNPICCRQCRCSIVPLFILPMRNGNKVWTWRFQKYRTFFLSYLWGMETYFFFLPFHSFLLSFYPTYEEWKLLIVALLFLISFHLFILPMRNGNNVTPKCFCKSCTNFLSYLWGMETFQG